MKKRPFPRPDWGALPNDGAIHIEGKVLLRDRRALVAMLRFAEHAGFEAHAAPWDCHVMCLEGSGFVLVGDEMSELRAGESVLWPKDMLHRLWTENSTMTTLMLEHVYQKPAP